MSLISTRTYVHLIERHLILKGKRFLSQNHSPIDQKCTIPVIFLRHGQSTWNQQNIFIGMTDTPLTEDGKQEARTAGKLISSDPRISSIDVVYCSLLRRATKTVWYTMEELGWEWVPVVKDWRLNERSYGALTGRNKKQCVELFGKDLVKKWRRSWDFAPPFMTKDHDYWPGRDMRYQALNIDPHQLPLGESLKDVTKRTSQFWDEVIVPQLKSGKRIMIVGHENNLRSLIKRLDNISDEAIIHLELPRAIPLVFELDRQTLKPVMLHDAAPGLSGRYIIDKKQLEAIAERDQQQVYDLKIRHNLETAPFLGVNPVHNPTPAEVDIHRLHETCSDSDNFHNQHPSNTTPAKHAKAE